MPDREFKPTTRAWEMTSSYVSSGGSIAQVCTSNAANYETVTGGSFKLLLTENQTVNYTISLYQNLTDKSNPTSGKRVCDINNTGALLQEQERQNQF